MISDAGKRILTVDQGNSSAKAVLWEGDKAILSRRIFSMSIEEMLPLFESGDVDGCAYCSVGHTDARFMETLRRMVDGHLSVLTPATLLPIQIKYGTRATLGNDRVAAAVGASWLFKDEGCLVVDAGTAITIDLITSDGVFLGGNIAPGVRLRFSSLHDATCQLPLVEPQGEIYDFGRDTLSAIRSGVVGGMVSEINDAYSRASELYGCTHLVLTGNDAPLLQGLLEDRGIPVYTDLNLVGRGLLTIFHYQTTITKKDNHDFPSL